jgi:NADH:ubiquinone oxidoreductase subunit 6 (subunit J)
MPLISSTETATTRRFAAWAIVPWVLLLLAAVGFVQYLRQAWSRSAMQVLALLLAVWSLVTAVLMLQQSGDFEIARQHARAQPQLGEIALWMIARAERTWQVGIGLKVLVIPVLLWLAWQLGRPAVRAQFRSRRR